MYTNTIYVKPKYKILPIQPLQRSDAQRADYDVFSRPDPSKNGGGNDLNTIYKNYYNRVFSRFGYHVNLSLEELTRLRKNAAAL